jgi:hypothetical protein
MTALRIAARDMHPGDIWQMHDWRLHVTSVLIEGGNVVVVTEGPTMRHVPADELEEVDR